mmetsp:Transcript_3602/g.10471  ORF Transcript_3602/g.10471 Transcript_3602/m.10471 type:complete len:231 (+) Transcript_3602:95-787(+)
MAMTMSRPVAMQAGLSRAAPSLSLRASPMAPARMAVRMQAAQRNVDSQVMKALDKVAEVTSSKGAQLASVGGMLAASSLWADSAEAAQEIGQLAGSDNRISIILTLFLPVVGWVLFNIGGPALRQLADTAQRNGTAFAKSGGMTAKRRGVTAAIGAGLTAASLLSAESADAATEVAQLAGDARISVIATLFVPLVGWVLFNIGGPALNQLRNQAAKNESANAPTKKGGRR